MLSMFMEITFTSRHLEREVVGAILKKEYVGVRGYRQEPVDFQLVCRFLCCLLVVMVHLVP